MPPKKSAKSTPKRKATPATPTPTRRSTRRSSAGSATPSTDPSPSRSPPATTTKKTAAKDQFVRAAIFDQAMAETKQQLGTLTDLMHQFLDNSKKNNKKKNTKRSKYNNNDSEDEEDEEEEEEVELIEEEEDENPINQKKRQKRNRLGAKELRELEALEMSDIDDQRTRYLGILSGACTTTIMKPFTTLMPEGKSPSDWTEELRGYCANINIIEDRHFIRALFFSLRVSTRRSIVQTCRSKKQEITMDHITTEMNGGRDRWSRLVSLIHTGPTGKETDKHLSSLQELCYEAEDPYLLLLQLTIIVSIHIDQCRATFDETTEYTDLVAAFRKRFSSRRYDNNNNNNFNNKKPFNKFNNNNNYNGRSSGSSSNPSAPTNQLFCNYCKKNGHTITTCPTCPRTSKNSYPNNNNNQKKN